MKKITLAFLSFLTFTAAQAADYSATCSAFRAESTCVTSELAGWGKGVRFVAIAKQSNFDGKSMGQPKVSIRDQSGVTLASDTGSGGIAYTSYTSVAEGKRYKARGYKDSGVSTVTRLDVKIERR